ncbi:acireductone synthase [Leptospira gomenensis]|uniref:Enolase-phosphatase E1 n=1 Tax=Leptospira gomenensis TaxID=2484974 RepID=A0A5F1YZJ1_9LEPT|nr:acireductone synthase [Leptospira gomenensis]TGK29495.1 acireductone synthase [Leptospira gomenensis]TGK33893.1 acireductone synthase [Leptospira gomenensis]TGK44843.1 acireductone synthase [Leptospira gomenensis]TGK64462.1 acireductone synthase [Leptospira gomenensis]
MDVSTFELYLFDIEGTTTPIEFVHKTLFPYSVSKFGEFFRKGNLEKTVLEGLIREGKADVSYSKEVSDSVETLIDYCEYLVGVDRKSGPLKEIQGRIWKEGYENGELKSLMFADVPEFLKRIRSSEKKAAVYSSGSVQAQKLIFEYSNFGDLTGYFSGYFDTAVGGKRESESYSRIARELGIPPEKIIFFTDVKEEADAATRAGCSAAVLERPGNTQQPAHGYARLTSFETVNP